MAIFAIPLLSACAFFFVTTNFKTAHACNGKNLTFERCTTHSDCQGYSELFLSSSRFCFGYDEANTFLNCPNDSVKECLCYPSKFTYCDSHTQCPDEEYCGFHPRFQFSFCTGCLSLPNFAPFPLALPLPSDRCTNTDSHRPCGEAFDHCSPTLPCAAPHMCLQTVQNSLFECSSSSTSCVCGIESFNQASLAGFACMQNDDCPSPREACAHDTRTRLNYCYSCDAIDYTPFVRLPDSSKCDALDTPRPPARHYPPSPNGLTYDLCTHDAQCVGDRSCMQFENLTAVEKTTIACKGLNELCFCGTPVLKTCTTGTDCDQGESCAMSLPVELHSNCASNAFLDSISADDYDIVGNRSLTLQNGTLLTNDPCDFDWQCKDARRCTHVLDEWGGCAARGACTCQPLTSPPCDSDVDCDAGEACVKFPDSLAKPFCSSATNAAQNPTFFVPVNVTLPPPPPTQALGNGLREDTCVSDADCIQGLMCKHGAEIEGECDGRNFCFCTALMQQQCNFTSDCPNEGEVCVGYKGAYEEGGDSKQRECISRRAFESETTGFRQEYRTISFPLPTPFPSVSMPISVGDETNSENSTDESPEPSSAPIATPDGPMTILDEGDEKEEDITFSPSPSLEDEEEEEAFTFEDDDFSMLDSIVRPILRQVKNKLIGLRQRS